VVQDVFMVVHRQLPDYEPRSAARAWIFSITRRVAADCRRAMRRREGALPLHEALASRACDDPLRDTLNKERSELIVDFLGSLDDLHREVFILCELEQMTAPEIAEAVGAGTSAVYSRIRTARQAFVAYVQARHPELMGGSNG
jgi:RNA polymerase sigma-70 factor (ECF subfamily)